MNNETTKFETGQTYQARFICNSDNLLKCQITRRTNKSVWVSVDGEQPVRRSIKTHNGVEICYPLGNYRNTPMLKASKLIK